MHREALAGGIQGGNGVGGRSAVECREKTRKKMMNRVLEKERECMKWESG